MRKRIGIVFLLLVLFAGSALGALQLNSAVFGNDNGQNSDDNSNSKDVVNVFADNIRQREENRALLQAIGRVSGVGDVGTGFSGSGFLVNSNTFVTSGHVVAACSSGVQITFYAFNRTIFLPCSELTISEDRLFAFAILPRWAREVIEENNVRFFHPAPDEISSDKLAMVASYTIGLDINFTPLVQMLSTTDNVSLTAAYNQDGIEELEALYGRDYREFADSFIFVWPRLDNGTSGSPVLRVHDDGSLALIGMAELRYSISRVDLLMDFLDIHNISWE